jgi:aspartate-semialdehyde dehydrogenase
MDRLPVVVLGATGMVGQRMVERLARHPWFRVAAVAASTRSEGRPYAESATWRLGGEPFGEAALLSVLPCDPEAVPSGIRLALSALDASAAREIEGRFRQAGFAVVSNASSYRCDDDVPLVIPEVNADHLELVRRQQGPGYIVTNPNCSSIPLTLVLAPLHRVFGVEAVCASTWQAVSGAGYPGESAWDMVGNVHPHAGDEEAKMASEPAKMLGTLDAPAIVAISARCVRVPVADGHLVSAQIRLRGNPSVRDVKEVLRAFNPDIPEIPSSPKPLFHFTDRRDRPSPRFDADAGLGMAVTIGRVEPCPVMGVKLFCLAHNTIRGAAGAAIANLEILKARDMLPGPRGSAPNPA